MLGIPCRLVFLTILILQMWNYPYYYYYHHSAGVGTAFKSWRFPQGHTLSSVIWFQSWVSLTSGNCSHDVPFHEVTFVVFLRSLLFLSIRISSSFQLCPHPGPFGTVKELHIEIAWHTLLNGEAEGVLTRQAELDFRLLTCCVTGEPTSLSLKFLICKMGIVTLS